MRSFYFVIITRCTVEFPRRPIEPEGIARAMLSRRSYATPSQMTVVMETVTGIIFRVIGALIPSQSCFGTWLPLILLDVKVSFVVVTESRKTRNSLQHEGPVGVVSEHGTCMNFTHMAHTLRAVIVPYPAVYVTYGPIRRLALPLLKLMVMNVRPYEGVQAKDSI